MDPKATRLFYTLDQPLTRFSRFLYTLAVLRFTYDVAKGANEKLFRSRYANIPAGSKILRVLAEVAGRHATLVFFVDPDQLKDEEKLRIWLRGQIMEWVKDNPPPN